MSTPQCRARPVVFLRPLHLLGICPASLDVCGAARGQYEAGDCEIASAFTEARALVRKPRKALQNLTGIADTRLPTWPLLTKTAVPDEHTWTIPMLAVQGC